MSWKEVRSLQTRIVNLIFQATANEEASDLREKDKDR